MERGVKPRNYITKISSFKIFNFCFRYGVSPVVKS